MNTTFIPDDDDDDDTSVFVIPYAEGVQTIIIIMIANGVGGHSVQVIDKHSDGSTDTKCLPDTTPVSGQSNDVRK